MNLLTCILFALCFVLVVIYLIFKKHYKFWSDRNIPHIPPEFPFGNIKGVWNNISFGEKYQSLYNQLKDKGGYSGIYILNKPTLFVTDPELIKTILVGDFDYFADRGLYFNTIDDPLSCNLFLLEGNEWRNLRNKLEPVFASGKIKLMFNTLLNVSDDLVNYVQEISSTEIDARELTACFTADVISSSVFGIKGISLINPNSELRDAAHTALNHSLFQAVCHTLANNFRSFARSFGYKIFPREVTRFFTDLVEALIYFRKAKPNPFRGDFMQILLNLTEKEIELQFTNEEITANTFQFFYAGFEATTSTMTFVMLMLARYKNIQENARMEINEVLKLFRGELTYEAIGKMKLIHRIIQETLRLYPPIPALNRHTTKPYVLPNGSEIPVGTKVVIPVCGIHSDENYFPNPESFDPDRFLPENIKHHHPYTYIPFGEGKRNCIGQKFAQMQIVVGLVQLLSNFKIEPTSRTNFHVQPDSVKLVNIPRDEVWIKFRKL